MAINWLPTDPYPPWQIEELGGSVVSFSSIQVGITFLQELGYTKANPTALENNSYFKGVRCDEDHPCSGIMIVSTTGTRFPFAYCTGATHKSALVLWVVGYDAQGNPHYDLGWGSGDFIP